MLFRTTLAASVVAVLCLLGSASSQTSQVEKKWELGRSLAERLLPLAERIERKDGLFPDSAYVQQIQRRVAMGVDKPPEIRVTSAAEWYAFLLPNGIVYFSAGLLERLSSEAELAGLLAHELAHAQANIQNPDAGFEQCVLATGYLPVRHGAAARSPEKRALQTATTDLRSAGYDPFAVLDLFPKLGYEHPSWSQTIVMTDLLDLRAALEASPPSEHDHSIDNSSFAKFHETVVRWLGHWPTAVRTRP